MMASDELISASGWSQFDTVPQEEDNQKRLDFSHDVAKIFKTREGKRVLKAMVQQYLVNSFTNDNDPYAIVRKQGRADVVKQIMAQIELSDSIK